MRSLKNMSHEEAQKNGWEILKPLNCEVVGKAIFNDSPSGVRIMKSTKRFEVPGGWVYNTSTEIHKQDKVAVAEALVFVPAMYNTTPYQPR